MNYLFELLKISVSGILVLIVTYFILSKMIENSERRRYFEMKKESVKTLTPIKLTAYERLALLLERINPESLVVRVQQPGMSARMLHLALIATIKEEFDHNVAQQIYVSDTVWLMVRGAKENLLQFINTVASQVPDDMSGMDLGKAIIQKYDDTDDATPIQAALEGLKREVRGFQ